MVVVVLTSQRQLVASVGHTEEDLHVQAPVAQSAVEALDITVFDGSSWPNEVRVHCVPIGPQIHRRLHPSCIYSGRTARSAKSCAFSGVSAAARFCWGMSTLKLYLRCQVG